MFTKRRNLYLYLTLVCFIGLIAIFIFDGYMGVYDNLDITTGEREETIEADFWLRENYFWSTGVNWDDKVFFNYGVVNRRFSSYSADIEVSVWHNQQKVFDLVSQEVSIAAFDEASLEWVLDTVDLKSESISPEQRYDFSVVIKRGDIERRLILYINPSSFPKLPVPTG